MTNVNTIAVLISAVITFALGWAWYGAWFGRTWMRLAGITKEQMAELSKKDKIRKPATGMILGFVCMLLTSYVFAIVLNAFGAYTLYAGVTTAFWIWLGFFAPVALTSYLWEMKSIKLFVINGGFYLVQLIIAAAVLTLWV